MLHRSETWPVRKENEVALRNWRCWLMQVDVCSGHKTVVGVFVCLMHHIYIYNSRVFFFETEESKDI